MNYPGTCEGKGTPVHTGKMIRPKLDCPSPKGQGNKKKTFLLGFITYFSLMFIKCMQHARSEIADGQEAFPPGWSSFLPR